jgi:anaerobic magnesium-protoporphyrin IX monomethyl ester cyclase
VKRKKVLLIRPPRYYWPFINEYDNFLLPQSLPCLAAALRSNGIGVRVIDCMPEKIGWQSLSEIIQAEKPDIVGVGDSESLYSNEVIRTFRLAKELDPCIVTVSGGAHFSNLIEESLTQFPIDFIVIGEGELSFVELVGKIDSGLSALREVRGIAFKDGNEIVRTPPRPLVCNLDDLPLPAYDLMPMDAYGKAKFLFSSGGITIHHSRGCVSNCDFCVWWVQMSESVEENGTIVRRPKWRTKSVSRTIEEIELLYETYGKKFLIFVDDSWNVSPEWSEAFADAVLAKGLRIKWFAFMRADFILRDEKLGIMEKLVRAGLTHVSIGAERAHDTGLDALGKGCYRVDMVQEVMDLMRRKYPQVFRQVTFIVGTRDETRESMWEQLEYAKRLHVDYPAFHPMTPVPGTKLWNEAQEKGWLELKDYSFFDWSTPVMPSKYLSRHDIDQLLYEINKKYANVWWLVKGLCSRHVYRRDMYIWWVIVVLKMIGDSVKNFAIPSSFKEYTHLVKPTWYDA